jgi:hypothetical protein
MSKHINIGSAIESQFAASISMLENAIISCPRSGWDTSSNFWYIAFHCIFWTDYYLTEDPNKFEVPAPFNLSEFDPSGIKPPRVYTKEELLIYIDHCKLKSQQLCSSLSSEKLLQRWVNEYKDFSLIEILIYNIRHVQHHTAQLNLLLRQSFNQAPVWVSQA